MSSSENTSGAFVQRKAMGRECIQTARELCVSSHVTVNPDVKMGEVRTRCVGIPTMEPCPETAPGERAFLIKSMFCVEVPLIFSADATAVLEENGRKSGEPYTRTVGYYKTHQKETEALIRSAGGSFVLGRKGCGAEYTVTQANAVRVLSFDTPSPPAPRFMPLAVQYQNLYAQLLAAKLNFAAGAACAFASQAIREADEFLATSVPGAGKPGALPASAPLEQYNLGKVPNGMNAG